jgi:ankyrin repeat protein
MIQVKMSPRDVSFYPIHLAIYNSLSENVIVRLIEEFPQIIQQEIIGCTPNTLHLALCCSVSDNAVLRIFNVFPDAAKEAFLDTDYPLTRALQRRRSEEVVLTLLKEYPTAASIYEFGESALHYSILHNYSERVVFQLIKAYPEAIQGSVYDGEFLYPFHYACLNDHSENTILLLLYTFPQVAMENDNSLFHAIESKQSDRVVLILINYNLLAVKNVDNDGNTPLYLATAYESSEPIINVLEQLTNKSVTELRNRIDIPKIVLSHSINNVLGYDTIQWLLNNTPVIIKGVYVQQSRLCSTINITIMSNKKNKNCELIPAHIFIVS